MTQRLNGKIAVITGATSGIGLATAKRFVAEGARLFITGRRADVLEKAVAEIGGDVTGIQADSSKLDDLDHLYAEVKEKAGRIDVLFVNAGGGSFAPIGEITEEQYDDTFGRNVKGVLFTVQKALPLLGQGILGHPYGLDRRLDGHRSLQRLRRLESSDPQLLAQLDPRSEGPRHPHQHAEPGPDRNHGSR